MLKTGSVAPDFSVPLHTGEMFRLSEYRGRKHVVLYFYPKDFTTGCTEQACTFSDHSRESALLEAMIIGISADGNESHRKFAAAHKLQFPLGADENRAVSRMYDALRFGVWPLRVTYVIDKIGVIRNVIHYEIAIHRHWESVIDILREIEVKQ
jgi:peroxiredoxin Q/BCP